MKLPPLTEIIDKLEKIPVTSWKGLNPGGGMMFYSPESKTDRIYPYQDCYAIDINGMSLEFLGVMRKIYIKFVYLIIMISVNGLSVKKRRKVSLNHRSLT